MKYILWTVVILIQSFINYTLYTRVIDLEWRAPEQDHQFFAVVAECKEPGPRKPTILELERLVAP